MLEQVGWIKSGEIGQLHTEFRHDATVAATLQACGGPACG
jgi:hypothetical protein